jgi:hypothetical protein
MVAAGEKGDADQISCPGDCSLKVPGGERVTLVEVTGEDSAVQSWGVEGCAAFTSTCEVLMDTDRTVVVNFAELVSLGLTTKGPGRIFCTSGGGSCTPPPYPVGTQVELEAVPDLGAAFYGWGGACSGTTPFCSLTLDSSKDVTGAFGAPLRADISIVGPGTVTSDSPEVVCGAGGCGGTVSTFGQRVTLTAQPTGSATFGGWSGDCAGTGTCVLVMDASRSATATFVQDTTPPGVTLTVSANGRSYTSSVGQADQQGPEVTGPTTVSMSATASDAGGVAVTRLSGSFGFTCFVPDPDDPDVGQNQQGSGPVNQSASGPSVSYSNPIGDQCTYTYRVRAEATDAAGNVAVTGYVRLS